MLTTALFLALQVATALPNGPLTLFAGTTESANFIMQDTITRSGDRVQVSIFRVYGQSQPVGGREIVQEVFRLDMDCTRRQVRSLGATAFDEAGAVVVELPAENWQTIQPDTTYDFVARLQCDGVVLPANATVQGHAAAREAGRRGMARLRP